MDVWFLRKSNLKICQETDKYELDSWKRRIRCLRVWPCNGEDGIGQIFKFDLLKNVTLDKKILFYAFAIKFTYILQISQIDFPENEVSDALLLRIARIILHIHKIEAIIWTVVYLS